MLEKLNDNTKSDDAFHRAGELAESAREGLRPWREPPERTRAYTNALIAAASSGAVARVATAARTSGTVKAFSEIRGYGFISNDDGGEAFVHYTGIAGRGYRNLVKEQRVEYTIMETSRGSKAIDVEVI